MAIVDEIWNRACDRRCAEPRAGDAALGALLLFHGAAMNGGIDHAIECLTSEQVQAAAVGYRYFGFGRVAEMVFHAPERFRGLDDDAHEAYLASAEHVYGSEIPGDSILVDRFQRHHEANPDQYAPMP
jgi:hypothetical protein